MAVSQLLGRETKHCPQCDAELPADAFYADKRRYDGLSSYCKECTRAQRRAYYARNAAVEYETKKRHNYYKSKGVVPIEYAKDLEESIREMDSTIERLNHKVARLEYRIEVLKREGRKRQTRNRALKEENKRLKEKNKEGANAK